MKITSTIILYAIILFTGATQAADPVVLPVKLGKAQIAGSIFTDVEPVVEKHLNERGPFTTEDVETFLSSDRHFDTGMYRSGANRFVVDQPYGVDEFMFFIAGGVTLTSANGVIMEITAGEAVTIPREWTGTWETDGYTKIYVIYSPDKPIQ